MKLIFCLFSTFFSLLVSAEGYPPYAIAQGPTSENTTQFSIFTPAADQANVTIVDANGTHLPFQRKSFFSPDGQSEVIQVFVENLDLAKTYTLKTISSDDRFKDERTFNLLPKHAYGRPLKAALVSCMADVFHNVFAWEQLEAKHPDVILISGDAVYLDRPHLIGYVIPKTIDDIWSRHARTRQRLYLYRMQQLIPIVSVHDDHDFGFNNALPPWELSEQAKQVYEIFFSRTEIPGTFDKGPGLASRFQVADHQFLFMDDRTFQSREKIGDYYGYQQEMWMKRMATAPVVWLVNGAQFFGGYLEKDSYQFNHPDDFDRYIRMLKAHPSRFNFLTGDIHFSEMMKIPEAVFGYPSYEITSSSMHSGSFPGRHKILEWLGWKNPWRMGATSTHNFALIEMEPPARDGSEKFSVEFVTWRGHTAFRADVSTPAASAKTPNCDDIVNPVLPRKVL